MELGLVCKPMKIQERVFEEQCEHLEQYEIIVPDYLPDVFEVLDVCAYAYIKEKTVENESITICGDLVANILFLPQETGCLRSIENVVPFKHVFDAKDVKQGVKICAMANVAFIEGKIINSRKIGIKAVLDISAKAYCANKLNVPSDFECQDEVQVRKKDICICAATGVESKQFAVHDELELSYGKPQIADLLRVDTSAMVKDTKLVMGRAIIKGSLLVRALYISDMENGDTEYMNYELPFSHVIDMEGLTDNCTVDICMTLKSVDYEVRVDDSGEQRHIGIEAIIDLTAVCYCNISAETLCDAYSTRAMMNIKKRDVAVDELIDKCCVQVPIRESISPAPGMPEIERVLQVWGKPLSCSAEVSNCKLMVSGEIELLVLYLPASETCRPCMIKKVVQFNNEREIKHEVSGAMCTVNTAICGISYSINMAGEIDIRLSCELEIIISSEKQFELLELAEIDEKNKCFTCDASVIIYYPVKGDTMWDIAKRYGIPVKDLLMANGMENDKETCGDSILIPCTRD